MSGISCIIDKHISEDVALYGLGTETGRFLNEWGEKINVVGLLDSYRVEGELYGHPILSLEQAAARGVKLIIVVARPGSCKAIAKRIGDFCRENDIALFDVRGRDLLAQVAVSYDLSGVVCQPRSLLMSKIKNADVVSFDLFDTLVARKVFSYTDVFELVDARLREKGIVIPDLPIRRLAAEKEFSKNDAPTLEEIYEKVIEGQDVSGITASKLAETEFETDKSCLVPRQSMCEIFKIAVSAGKKVIITTDSYYNKEDIAGILERFGLDGYAEIFDSCEYGTSKTMALFDRVSETFKGRILHIGDDEYADITPAAARSFDTFRIYKGEDLFDALGGMGLDEHIKTLADRVKTGMFIARIFNDPFCFEKGPVSIADVSDIGYMLCAPMITDFTLWMQESISRQGYEQVLFGARDGYLFEKLYEISGPEGRSYYFLTSRTAAIRAGMETQEDIDYVDGMKYSGTPADATRERFGIDVTEVDDFDRSKAILKKAKQQRENYRRYIDKLGIGEGKPAFFDFVAKGTTQMYLQKLFAQRLKGFYFLQLEPEFMADKGLDIEPFYSEEEKDSSAIFDNYYILETILTAPFPQMMEMGSDGEPVFAKETRSEMDLKCFERAQGGIIEYFKEYLDIVPESARTINKELDEKLLELVNKVKILDEDFLALKVEDPFFGRITAMTDVIG